VTADAYVAALDVPGIQRLLPAPWRQRWSFFDDVYKLVGVPVITVQLRCEAFLGFSWGCRGVSDGPTAPRRRPGPRQPPAPASAAPPARSLPPHRRAPPPARFLPNPLPTSGMMAG
jgi:hypothetical protein